MLTKSDLQQMRNVVKEEVQGETKPIKEDIATIKTGVSGLKTDVSVLNKGVSGLKTAQAKTDKVIKSINRKTTKIRNDLEMAIGFLDKDRSEVSKRVDRIDNYLHVSSTAS